MEAAELHHPAYKQHQAGQVSHCYRNFTLQARTRPCPIIPADTHPWSPGLGDKKHVLPGTEAQSFESKWHQLHMAIAHRRRLQSPVVLRKNLVFVASTRNPKKDFSAKPCGFWRCLQPPAYPRGAMQSPSLSNLQPEGQLGAYVLLNMLASLHRQGRLAISNRRHAFPKLRH